METTWEGRIAGVFKGYRGAHVYELPDGSRWGHKDRTDAYVYCERPKARLLRDRRTGMTYLDVEGTSGVVLAVPDSGMRGLSVGAF